MKTLQELLDAKLAEMRAAQAAATHWRNRQPLREAEAADAFVLALQECQDVAVGEDALVEAFEQECAVGATHRVYDARLYFPGLDAYIGVCLATDGENSWYRDDKRYFANVGGNLKPCASLGDALLWITDNGQTALGGAPVPVTLPELQEA